MWFLPPMVVLIRTFVTINATMFLSLVVVLSFGLTENNVLPYLYYQIIMILKKPDIVWVPT